MPWAKIADAKKNRLWSGNLENEEEILEWLVSQLEKDEIEDITDEMLDRLIKDGKTLAVLFCKLPKKKKKANQAWNLHFFWVTLLPFQKSSPSSSINGFFHGKWPINVIK